MEEPITMGGADLWAQITESSSSVAALMLTKPIFMQLLLLYGTGTATTRGKDHCRRTDCEGFSTHLFNCNAVSTSRKLVSPKTHKDSIGARKFGLSDNVHWESGARDRDEDGLTTRTLKADGFAAGFVTPFCSVEKQAVHISCHFLLACSAAARVEKVWQVCLLRSRHC